MGRVERLPLAALPALAHPVVTDSLCASLRPMAWIYAPGSLGSCVMQATQAPANTEPVTSVCAAYGAAGLPLRHWPMPQRMIRAASEPLAGPQRVGVEVVG